MAAEAVILFKPSLAETLGYRRKRGGHLFSKMRFLSAQLAAYLSDDLWLKNAAHANAMARRLAEGLAALPGVSLSHPVEANEVFARLPETMIEGLLADGFQFYRWGPAEDREIRLIAAFDSAPQDVEAFLTAAAALASKKTQGGAGLRA